MSEQRLFSYQPALDGLRASNAIARAQAQTLHRERTQGVQRAQERYLSEANLALVERLLSYAQSRGHGLLELAISWLLAQRGVASVIAGATKPEQAAANAAAGAWRMSAEELAEVTALL